MYCENCGRWLNDGEKCDCRKRKRRNRKKGKFPLWVAILAVLLVLALLCLIVIMGWKSHTQERKEDEGAIAGTEKTASVATESSDQDVIQVLTELEKETAETAAFAVSEETEAETLSDPDSLESKITGIWYRNGMVVPTYEFNEDGTGTYLSRYPYHWELDEDQTLCITYLDSDFDTETFYDVRINEEEMEFDYETESGSIYADTCSRTPAYIFYADGEYNYSEGKVWIRCGGVGFSYWVCVDKEGKGLFCFDSSGIKELSSFSNGYAYITGEDYVAIVDDNGNVTSRYCMDSTHFVLAKGDGYILTEEFVADFDTSGYVVRLCGHDGTILAQSTRETDGIENEYQITDHTARSAHYCGEGIFGVKYQEGAEFLTSAGKVWSAPDEDFNINLNFHGGLATRSYSRKEDTLTCMNTEGEFIRYDIDGADLPDSGPLKYRDGILAYKCGSGSTLAVYDMEKHQEIRLEQYTDKIDWSKLSDRFGFTDGRIVVPLQGEDGELYVSVFDKEWNTILEPVRAEHYCGYSEGYLIVNDGETTCIYDTDGQAVYSGYAGNQDYTEFSDGVTRLTQYLVENSLYYNEPLKAFMDVEGNMLYDKIDMSGADKKNVYDTGLFVFAKVEDTPKTQLTETSESILQTGQGQTEAPENVLQTEQTGAPEGMSSADQSQTDVQALQSGEEQTGEEGIHRYEMLLQNGTWEDAFNACAAKGGHLARINTQEEYDYIIDELERLNCRDYRFYIGGRRDLDGQQYFWVDDANAFIGTDLDSADAWCSGNWMIGEPSLRDDTINAAEHVMELFYYEDENRWVWNDVPNNLPDYIGESAAKKVGFICEYDE